MEKYNQKEWRLRNLNSRRAYERAGELVGQRFGRLFVGLAVTGVPGSVLCRCDCGQICEVKGSQLRNGNVRSCGCLARDVTVARNTTHGGSKSREYEAWCGMRRRCYDPRRHEFKRYGGRGITVCDRWRFGDGGMSGFECFIADMGPKPVGDYSLDRIDNAGNYEPGNCRWATRSEQAKNQRPGYRFGDPLRVLMEGRHGRAVRKFAHTFAPEGG